MDESLQQTIMRTAALTAVIVMVTRIVQLIHALVDFSRSSSSTTTANKSEESCRPDRFTQFRILLDALCSLFCLGALVYFMVAGRSTPLTLGSAAVLALLAATLVNCSPRR